MKFPRRSSLAASVAVAALCLTVPAQAASAATTTNASEATFNEFVATLDVSAETKEGLKEYFAELPDAQQDAYIADPASLFTLDDGGTTVTEETAPAAQARSTNAVAAAGAVRTLRVNNKQNAQIAGFTVSSFNLDYVYEADSTRVVRNLDCAGSASGALLSASSSPSNYVTNDGRGVCNVRTNVNVFFQGSPVQFTKLHTVMTDNNNPARVTGSIRTV